jgi:hypothetical protein
MRYTPTALLFATVSVVSFAQQPFRLEQSADIDQTHLIVNVDLAPRFLVEAFGNPSEGDGYKVSGIYTFISEKKDLIFTVYDWKSTNLFDEVPGAPSPQEFCASKKPTELSIGGKSKDATKFKAWLTQKYKIWQQSKGPH